MQFTTKHWAIAFALVILACAALPSVHSAAPSVKATQWEYKVDANVGMLQAPQLNGAGVGGWELVTIAVENRGNCTAVYKRPK